MFTFGDSELEVVRRRLIYTYLGVTINYNGHFKKATSISKQVCQARRGMFSLLGKIRRLQLPMDIASDLFDKLVLPYTVVW